MMHAAARRLADWSTAIYPVMLYVYPVEFRREFGESMAQTFADQTRHAYRTSGLLGLLTLWMRTAFDLAAGVLAAYRPDPERPLSRASVGAVLLFVCALTGVVSYSAIRFGEFYAPPAFNQLGAPGAHEDELIAAYEAARGGTLGEYKRFVNGAGLALAVLLGFAAGMFGLWQKSPFHGLGALATGAVLTIVALELMPTIWFPFDTYAVGAVWVVGGMPVATVICLLALYGRRSRLPVPFM
jgi:hypothetical protein